MEQIFDGFRRETLAFLGDLKRNNKKEWFAENRDRYEQFFLTPALGFVDAMEDAAAALNPPHKAVAKINGSVRRINRDVRFSKNKAPYNSDMHLVFWTGDHPNRSPAIHIIIHPEGIGYGSGQWAFDAAGIGRYREAISKSAPRKALLEALATAGEAGCKMGPLELKRVPREFDADVAWSELLKRKSLVTRTFSGIKAPDVIFTRKAVDYFVGLFDQLAPLNAWIDRHIGS